MKRTIVKGLAVFLVVIFIFSLSSCGGFIEDLVSRLEELETTQTETQKITESHTETQKRENVIPFDYAPELKPYSLPGETFTDPIEKEASDIIDASICKAISCLNAMKDNRHSFSVFNYEEDPNGFLSQLDNSTKNAFHSLSSKARNFENYSIKKEEYSGDLKEAFFSLSEPMMYCDPFVNSYMTITPKTYGAIDPVTGDIINVYLDIHIEYFNPYKDGNATLAQDGMTTEELKHSISLFEHIIRRIIRFMPDNLSTYDKYYYLAVVVTEQVKYDKRPDNCYTAFGALVCGRAVCEGYSTAYALLCREANLYCAYRMSKSHIWNMVKLEDGIYNVDLTWADDYEPNTYDWYRFFVRTDEQSAYSGHEPVKGVEGTGSGSLNPYS
ncbi:MAG: hypothetical protein K6F14_07465 [Clostridiales bacterium]|nr:hypothetical protein [Clostridiales bacterium]